MHILRWAGVVLLWGCDTTPKETDSGTSSDTGTPAGVDADQDGFVEGDDCDDGDASINPDATEVCNGSDDDCDGLIDDADSSWDASTGEVWYADLDGDSYGTATTSLAACSQPDNYVADSTDCDDGDAAINPEASEVCNGSDDDCDGLVDDDDDSVDLSTAGIYYVDADGDGYGAFGTAIQACGAPSGYVADSTDCNDGSDAIYPGALESCNGVDDDCDPSSSEEGTIDVAGVAYVNLAPALASANAGDTVTLCDGTYTGSFYVPDGVTVTSFNGADRTILQGDGSGSSAILMLDGAANILDLTFQGGFALLGGAIDGYSGKVGGDISIYNCVFDGNAAGFGGAVLGNLSHSLTIVDSIFTNNIAAVTDGTNYYGSGGAVYAADLDIQGSTFDGNEGHYGGAIYVEGEATIDASTTITNNLASSYSSTESGYGGAFYCYNGRVTLDATDISDNSAAYFGGGGLTLNCDVSGGTYSGNTAGSSGGGMYFYSDDANQFDSATITNNDAPYGGGVMFDGAAGAGILSASDLVIEDNYASLQGGGAWVYGAILELSASSLNNNSTAGAGGGAYLGSNTSGSEALMICDGVDVTGNTAVNGAGFYLERSELDLSGGQITDNAASSDGGGAYLTGSELSSSKTDWEGSGTDNSPDDIYDVDFNRSYDSYGTSETFSCDTSGCN